MKKYQFNSDIWNSIKQGVHTFYNFETGESCAWGRAARACGISEYDIGRFMQENLFSLKERKGLEVTRTYVMKKNDSGNFEEANRELFEVLLEAGIVEFDTDIVSLLNKEVELVK